MSSTLPVLPQPLPPAGGAPERLADPRAGSFFRRSTIQTRLTVAFWCLGGMSLFGTLLAIWQIGALQERAVAEVRTARATAELHAAATASSAQARALAATGNGAAAAVLAPALRANQERLDRLHDELARTPRDARQAGTIQEAAARGARYRQAYQAALGSRDAAGQASATSLRELGLAADAYVQSTQAAMDLHADSGEGTTALQEQAGRARSLLLWVFFGLTVVTIPFVVVLFVHILKPMYIAVRIARKVADGDLTVKVRTGGTDEMARLMLALDDMTMSLRRIVREVLRGADTVAGTAARVRQDHQDLSQRTETQASTLQQTASSMEELTATVAQNAGHAREASQLASGAADVAREGGDLVQKVVAAMGGLSSSVRRIEEISSLIDGIAFQTNILALNAAVEAARAGDQGRGFAVVAAEVRTLAQRSAQAAREIKALSVESMSRAGDGTRLVDAAGRTMAEVVGSIGRVSRLIADIAAASEEQRSGIEQVGTAVSQMDRIVQQNAALVEQTGQATEALHTHADALLHVVAQFRLEGAEHDAVAPEDVVREGKGWMALPGRVVGNAS